MFFQRSKDLVKVGLAAGTNVVAAGARSAIETADAAQAAAHSCSTILQNVLLGCQIVVAVVTVAYIGLKLYRLWKDKKATS